MITILEGRRQGLPFDSISVTTYSANKRKAWNILEGRHPYTQFKGLKVRNFWRNLSEPNHPEAVTIDGHMANVLRNKLVPMNQAGVTRGQYIKMAGVVRRLAQGRMLLPCQVQAVCWFAWKRRHGIKVDGQMWLWEYEDVRPNYALKDIKPYPFR